jgi:hypothetical protein
MTFFLNTTRTSLIVHYVVCFFIRHCNSFMIENFLDSEILVNYLEFQSDHAGLKRLWETI